MTDEIGIGEIEIGGLDETTDTEWMEEAMEEAAEAEYEHTYPFGQRHFPAVELEKENIDEQLFEWCIEALVISVIGKGYFITHSDLDKQLEQIRVEGIEAYLQQRLDDVGVSRNED